MNRPETSPGQAPGHHGTGDGESVPDDAPPQPAPKTDTKEPAPAASTPAVDASQESAGPSGSTTLGEDGNPVVFTPDDVHARPPDHPPTENAPESEKAGLIFERS